MKRIIIGDTHGRSFWKLILNTQDWQEAILIGDYFDTHEDITGLEQLNNFEQIVAFKKEQEEKGKKVILLIGNHDGYIYPEMRQEVVSGYQPKLAMSFRAALYENKDLLQMAYLFDNVLCSHAGIGETWLEAQGWKGENVADFVNDVWKYRPTAFMFYGINPYGDDLGQTPIWIRPRSLMKDSQNLKKSGFIQVVGHTQQNQIDIEGKATGGKYFFIDTLGTSGEYLIWTDGVFSTGKIN